MNSDRSLIREIYEWRRRSVPTERFRNGQRNAASFDLETVIDHLKSSVDGLLNGWTERRHWDYPSIVAKRMEDVEQAKWTLAQLELGPEEEARYAAYLDATDSLLRHLVTTR